MALELAQRNERIAAEICDALAKAKVKSEDCDCVLVILQRNKGGVVYMANESARIETLSFVATAFLHKFHEAIRQ